MPRKKKDPQIQAQVAAALDEIEAAQATLGKRGTAASGRACRSWIRKKKAELKALKYKGKLPRMPRTAKEG
jgi:hypothetical protein